jgi:DNA-binding NtrC family response regulator
MKHGTILVIDDNPAILTAVKICLGGTFERIVTLTSPEKVLTTITQEHPSAILLDMNFTLGVNSGQEGMMWLSVIHRKFPDIPIVLVTAYADVKLAVRALKNGAADFVTKPWDNDELIRVLKDAIDKASEIIPLDQLETEHVRKVLNKCDGNMKRAADLLGISRQTLYNKVKNEK